MIQTYADWLRHISNPDHYEPLLRQILRRESLPQPAAPITKLADGSSALFRVGNEPFLIKTVSPFDDGAADREALALRYFDASAIETPRLLARGRIDDTDYLVISLLHGHSLKDQWPRFDADARRDIAHKLGHALRTLHTLNLPDLGAARPRWRAFIQARIDHFFASADDTLLPPSIYDQSCRFINDHADLATDCTPRQVHADLHGSHILLEDHTISGIIDFGDSITADPIYDFVVPFIHAIHGEDAPWRALLSGYGDLPQDFSARILLYALLHRFPYLGHYGLERWNHPDWAELRRIFAP